MDRGLSCFIVGSSGEWKSGDDFRLAPPFIITREQVDEVVRILDEGITELQKELGTCRT